MANIGLAIKKILENAGEDAEHFLSAFSTSSLLTTAIANNASGDPEYIGYALPGTSKAASRWAIKKITYDASNDPADIGFAGGKASFTKIWNSRAGYSYS